VLKGKWLSAADLAKMQPPRKAAPPAIKKRLLRIDAALDSGDISHAQKAAEPLRSETTPWIAEWVLMSKARKLQSSKLPAAIQVAKWKRTASYPDSFFAHYLLADLLLQDHKLTEAWAADQQSLKLERTTLPPRTWKKKFRLYKSRCKFAPEGTYEIKLKNDLSGEVQNNRR